MPEKIWRGIAFVFAASIAASAASVMPVFLSADISIILQPIAMISKNHVQRFIFALSKSYTLPQ